MSRDHHSVQPHSCCRRWIVRSRHCVEPACGGHAAEDIGGYACASRTRRAQSQLRRAGAAAPVGAGARLPPGLGCGRGCSRAGGRRRRGASAPPSLIWLVSRMALLGPVPVGPLPIGPAASIASIPVGAPVPAVVPLVPLVCPSVPAVVLPVVPGGVPLVPAVVLPVPVVCCRSRSVLPWSGSDSGRRRRLGAPGGRPCWRGPDPRHVRCRRWWHTDRSAWRRATRFPGQPIIPEWPAADANPRRRRRLDRRKAMRAVIRCVLAMIAIAASVSWGRRGEHGGGKPGWPVRGRPVLPASGAVVGVAHPWWYSRRPGNRPACAEHALESDRCRAMTAGSSGLTVTSCSGFPMTSGRRTAPWRCPWRPPDDLHDGPESHWCCQHFGSHVHRDD